MRYNESMNEIEYVSSTNSFSGTDLDRNANNPGVVYPFNEGKDIPSFSGIFEIRNNNLYLAHLEYRLFNKIEDKDDSIILQYEKGEAYWLTKGYTKQLGLISRIFNKQPISLPNESSMNKDTTEVFKELLNVKFNPEVLVDKNNIKEKQYSNYFNNPNKFNFNNISYYDLDSLEMDYNLKKLPKESDESYLKRCYKRSRDFDTFEDFKNFYEL